MWRATLIVMLLLPRFFFMAYVLEDQGPHHHQVQSTSEQQIPWNMYFHQFKPRNAHDVPDLVQQHHPYLPLPAQHAELPESLYAFKPGSPPPILSLRI